MKRYGALITVMSAIAGLLIAADLMDFDTQSTRIWRYTISTPNETLPKEKLALTHFGFDEKMEVPNCVAKKHEGVDYWCIERCSTKKDTANGHSYSQFKKYWECEEVATAPCEQTIACDTTTFYEAAIGDTKLTPIHLSD